VGREREGRREVGSEGGHGVYVIFWRPSHSRSARAAWPAALPSAAVQITASICGAHTNFGEFQVKISTKFQVKMSKKFEVAPRPEAEITCSNSCRRELRGPLRYRQLRCSARPRSVGLTRNMGNFRSKYLRNFRSKCLKSLKLFPPRPEAEITCSNSCRRELRGPHRYRRLRCSARPGSAWPTRNMAFRSK